MNQAKDVFHEIFTCIDWVFKIADATGCLPGEGSEENKSQLVDRASKFHPLEYILPRRASFLIDKLIQNQIRRLLKWQVRDDFFLGLLKIQIKFKILLEQYFIRRGRINIGSAREKN